jgi:tryptophan 2,3-dioxygenase
VSDHLDYRNYLNIEALLKLQKPVARPANHDETLFIVVHQVFELWFYLMLHEIDKVEELLDKGDVLET